MDNLILFPIAPEAFLQQLRIIIKEEIAADQSQQLQDRFLSPADTCKLFQPNISKVTLSTWTKGGLLKDYRFSGRVYYKYSEVLESAKHLQKFKRRS